jgi:hypothetical protein
MKKILAVALACTVSAFAAWDKFPVIEDGKGEAKIEFSKNRQGYDGDEEVDFKVRYSPLANLELLSQWDGFGGNYVIGARYQIIPVLSAGLDIGVPITEPAISLTPNLQFSMPLSDALSLGSNVEFTIPLENSETETTDYMNLVAGVEVDFKIGQSTIWVGFDFETGLGEQEPFKGAPQKVKASDADKGTKLSPAIGYIAEVGNLSLGTSVAWEFGEKSVGKDTFNTIVGLDASVKF